MTARDRASPAIFLAAMAAASVWPATPLVAQDTGQPPGVITVTGEGHVDVTPDMAIVTLGVTSEARMPAQAIASMADATRAVLDRVTSLGVSDRDIQTTNLSLGPRYSDGSASGPPVIAGYVASNMVTLRVRDLEALGAIIDTSVEVGGNAFGGLSFTLADPTPLQDEARRSAVEDAIRKAGLMAQAAGISLGPIIRITDQGSFTPQPIMMRGIAMADAAPPVMEGELSVTATVTVEFAIGQ